LIDTSLVKTLPQMPNKNIDREKIKEINKIKARISYLEKVLKEMPNKKKETELKILKKKLEKLV